MTGFLDALARLFGGRGSPRKPSGRMIVDLGYDGTTLSLEAANGDDAREDRWIGRPVGGWRMPPSNGTYLVGYDPRSPRRIAMRVPGDPPRLFLKEGEGDPGPFDLVLPADGFRLLRTRATDASLRNAEFALRVTVTKARTEPDPAPHRDDDLPTPSTQVDPYLPSQADNQAAAQLAGMGYLRAMEDRNTERAPEPAPVPPARDEGPVTGGGVGASAFETRGGDKAGGDFVTGGGDGVAKGGDFVTGGGDGRDIAPAPTTHQAPAQPADSWSPGSGGYGR